MHRRLPNVKKGIKGFVTKSIDCYQIVWYNCGMVGSKKKWTHVRVSVDTLESLKLISYLTGAPVSTILRIFAEEGVRLYEKDWEKGGGVYADKPDEARLFKVRNRQRA